MLKEYMTPIERIQTAINLKKPDRTPVSPFLFHHIAKVTGLTIDEFLFDLKKGVEASHKAYDIYGGVDMVSWFPGGGYVLFGGEQWYFGTEWVFKKNQPAQMNENKQWEIEDYDRIIEEGILKFMRKPKRIIEYFKANLIFRKEIRYWKKRNIDFWAGAVAVMPFEWFSWKRTISEFMLDIYRCPDKIKRASDFVVDGIFALVKLQSFFSGLKRVFFDCNRASGTFISPKIFEDLVFPSFHRLVKLLIDEGYEILFHLDTDWLPMLPFFRNLPRGKYILELEQTDIYKAKKVIGDLMCLKGNISSTLLRLGTPEEIEREAKKLIEEVGYNGGFILGSGCEVPIDAPLENVKAMIETAKKYQYE